MGTDRWVTSDTHFGHANVLEFDGRPWRTIDEHDEALIARWNETVKPRDEVYHLGDFAWNVVGMSRVKGRLNGKKHLVMGNHDFGWSQNKLKEVFVSLCQIRTVSVCGVTMLMCHYPIIDAARHDTPLLHGHVHNVAPERIAAIKALDFNATGAWYNVGCMLHDYRPVNLEDILAELKLNKLEVVGEEDESQS